MELELRFFATFRQTVGGKVLEAEYEDGATAGDVLRALDEEYPDLDLFGEDDSLREFVTVMKNGQQITHLEGLDTGLSDGDTLSVFPPVAGG